MPVVLQTAIKNSVNSKDQPTYSRIFVNESDIEENGMEVMGEEDMMFVTYYLSRRTIITNSILLFSSILCLWYFHFLGYVMKIEMANFRKV